MFSETDSKLNSEFIDINTYVHFHHDNPLMPRITSLSYFDEEVTKVMGLELRLVGGIPYRLVFSIVGASTLQFKPGSIRWAALNDTPIRLTDPPPAVVGTYFSEDGRVFEIHWVGNDATPLVSMFTVLVFNPGAEHDENYAIPLQGRLDPTIVNKPPEGG